MDCYTISIIILLGRFYVRSKYLRKIFLYTRIQEHNNHAGEDLICMNFVIKSPQVIYRLHSIGLFIEIIL